MIPYIDFTREPNSHISITIVTKILQIICDPESKGLSLDKQPLSLNSVAALSVMFTVYTENSIMSLHEVLQQQAHATSCSFNKVIFKLTYCF